MVTKNIVVAEIVIASRITLDLRILLVLAFEDMGLEGICSIYVLTSAFFLFRVSSPVSTAASLRFI